MSFLKPDIIIERFDDLNIEIWCGKRLGVRTSLVCPLGNKQPFNIVFKRYIEKIIKTAW